MSADTPSERTVNAPGPPQAGPPRTTVDAFEPGAVVGGRYEVLKRLGRGGMGVVYLAHDRKHDRKVALKTLLPEHQAKSRAVARFEREVNLARQLDHPCIVKIYNGWRLGDMLLYTMEYVEGQSLRNLLNKKERFGLGSTVRILGMLLHALHYAHKYTIHRDLSPDNVMVTVDGKIKLLDFGLAKPLEHNQAFTMIGVSLGKAQYNAPEQQVNAREVDRRADLFSVGIMFYEMLTGLFPEPGKMPPLLTLRPDLPPEAAVFFEKATARRAADRYQDAREMRKALKDLYELSRQPEAAPPPAPDITQIYHAVREEPSSESADVIDVTTQPPPLLAMVRSWLARLWPGGRRRGSR